jgi:hypothetical protein
MSWMGDGAWERGSLGVWGDWYAQLYFMLCDCELLRCGLWGHFRGVGLAKSIGLGVVKREDRSFLSICGNNDFIVIAIEIETGGYPQDNDLNLTNSSWVIIQVIITKLILTFAQIEI